MHNGLFSLIMKLSQNRPLCCCCDLLLWHWPPDGQSNPQITIPFCVATGPRTSFKLADRATQLLLLQIFRLQGRVPQRIFSRWLLFPHSFPSWLESSNECDGNVLKRSWSHHFLWLTLSFVMDEKMDSQHYFGAWTHTLVHIMSDNRAG